MPRPVFLALFALLLIACTATPATLAPAPENTAPPASPTASDTATPLPPTATPLPPTATPPRPTPTELLATDGRFSTLLTALETTQLAETINAAPTLTLFAPTDAAFAALGTDTLTALLADPDALALALRYHALPEALPVFDLAVRNGVTTLAEIDIAISLDSSSNVVLNTTTTVVEDNFTTHNGFIHVIDTALTPPGDLLTVLADRGNFTTLLTAIDTAGLTTTLSGDGPFTLFAPTNSAFANLPDGELTALLANPDTLARRLLYHILPDAVYRWDLMLELERATVLGPTIAIYDDCYKAFLNMDEATILTQDLVATNGIIHVIDSVLALP